MMRILQAMCFAAFLPWSFEKSGAKHWGIYSLSENPQSNEKV
jgi:hypothetical protein